MKLKHIVVSDENYEILRDLGVATESMNDVMTRVIKRYLELHGPGKVRRQMI